MGDYLGDIVAFIPLRGGSKSIPLKNIKLINGRPLVYWVLDAAESCNRIDRIVISTDSDEIKTVVENYSSSKILVIKRSKDVSTDQASTESQYSTSVADSLLSVVRQKRFIWETVSNYVKPVNYSHNARPRRQEFEGYLVENGAFYITSKERIISSKSRISGNISCYEMPEESYYELDEPNDWEVVESLLKKKKTAKKLFDLKNIKCVLADCDGVLTDAGMYYSEFGDEMKKFNTRDGMAFRLLKEQDVITGIITGENLDLVRRRAIKLKVDELHLGIENKLEVIQTICKRHNINLSQIAYIGDDINDLEVVKTVGFGCFVADAMESLKEHADYVTIHKGGNGAFREMADLILKGIG